MAIDTCWTCGISEKELREKIALAIMADHEPIWRQTYTTSFQACVCGHMSWPCQVGQRAAAIAIGETP